MASKKTPVLFSSLDKITEIRTPSSLYIGYSDEVVAILRKAVTLLGECLVSVEPFPASHKSLLNQRNSFLILNDFHQVLDSLVHVQPSGECFTS